MDESVLKKYTDRYLENREKYIEYANQFTDSITPASEATLSRIHLGIIDIPLFLRYILANMEEQTELLKEISEKMDKGVSA